MKDNVRIALTVVATVALTSVMVPLGASAASNLVSLIDADGDRARIENGKLRVGDGEGAMTVDGGVNTAPGGRPIHVNLTATGGVDRSLEYLNTYTVPTGRRLVVTHVSGQVDLPDPQEVYSLAIFTGEDAEPHPDTYLNARHYFAPDSDVTFNGRRVFTFAQDMQWTVPGGATLFLDGMRTGPGGTVDAYVFVTGYLQ